jgi:acyl carrier protein
MRRELMEEQIYNFIVGKLQEIVELNKEEITRDMKLDVYPIGMSSYDIIQLFSDLEEFFSVRIPDEYLFINKIDDVVRTVNDLLKNEKKYQQRIDAVKDKLFEK